MAKTLGRLQRLKKRRQDSEAQSTPTPLLLALPAEIRNLIYEFALTRDEVRVHWVTGTTRLRLKPELRVSSNPKASINQLKFVSRQLYQETAGTELKYNRVVFDDSSPSASTKRFFRFVTSCSAPKLQWLRQVVIEEKSNKEDESTMDWVRDNVHSILTLLDFCSKNPQITVLYRIPRFQIFCSIPEHNECYHGLQFLHTGIFLALAFHGKDYLSLVPGYKSSNAQVYDQLLSQTLASSRAAFIGFHGRADNLCLMPRWDIWEENEFMGQTLQNWSHVAHTPSLLPPGGCDKWLQFAKSWMEKGV
ncbi:hypothetical protein HBH98_077440 [Parastagonospora nodorum]|nr:hypothetical protein HBH50_119590 [Parastagonospora nodorum]KAH4100437.1 hypothetical protein HBH48_021130 [Parastagonospora nodorum]KAH4105455.1 hypothetical protein HBH46_084280 [Parastagonospora nodorum]KAH4122056.1 hypothetical protein HBH47_086690 [Parastagonospora nodorum]KAH4179135.1 hypothetical protein HBH43_013280 [Parastagonospora nodorum]